MMLSMLRWPQQCLAAMLAWGGGLCWALWVAGPEKMKERRLRGYTVQETGWRAWFLVAAGLLLASAVGVALLVAALER